MKIKYSFFFFSALILNLCLTHSTLAEPNIFSSAWNKTKGLVKQGTACLNVGVKATELGAKKAAFETAKLALSAAIELDKADPRIAALIAENKSIETAEVGLDATVATGKFGVEAISELGQTVGKVLAAGFNLTSVVLDETVADLKSGKLPTFAIEGVIAGKHFKIRVSANIKDAGAFAKSVFQELKKAI